jgi:uncharacterized protein YgiM (DUF1202 family)
MERKEGSYIMKNKILKKAVLLLALVMTLTVAGASLAVTGDLWDFGSPSYYPGSARVKTDAHVRKEPYALAEILGDIEKGEWVSIYGSTGDWFIIPWKDGVGYVYKGYFEDQAQPPVPVTEIAVKATANVNVRSGPGTGYTVIGSLQKGESVIKTGTNGNWTIIRYFGQTGYVYSKYLTDGTVPGGTPLSNVMEATTDVNVRKGPGTGYAIDGWLNKGDRVVKLGTSGSWAKIEWKGGTAYVYGKYLKEAGSVPSSGTRYAKVNTYVYNGPGTNYTKLASIYVGQSVTATGIVSVGWTQIIWNNSLAYVSSDCLTTVPGTPNGYPSGATLTATIRRALVNTAAYKGAGSSTGLVKLISANELVSCTGLAVGNWMQVITPDGYAFVAANCLSEPLYSYSSPAPDAKIMRAKNETPVFSSASASLNNIIAMLKKGDQVVRVAILDNGWAMIRLANGNYGYVSGSALE